MNEEVVELHPIANLAFFALNTVDGQHYSMSEEARARIERELETLFEEPELRTAVASLISLAKHLEDAHNVDVANALLAIAVTACPALDRQNAAAKRTAQDLGVFTAQTFVAFSDLEVVHTAPVDQTVKMRALAGSNGTLTIAGINAAKRKFIR